MENPKELKYTKTDEWVKVDGNVATIGVTDYAQSQLSDIVYLEFLVESGDDLKKGNSIVTMESVKAAADVNSPISGKIIEINASLADEFESINSDPFGNGWMIKVEMSDKTELDSMLEASDYSEYCENREH